MDEEKQVVMSKADLAEFAGLIVGKILRAVAVFLFICFLILGIYAKATATEPVKPVKVEQVKKAKAKPVKIKIAKPKKVVDKKANSFIIVTIENAPATPIMGI